MIKNSRSLRDFLSEYISQLLQLHQLIASGQGDSEAADIVRDRMDSPWNHLSRDEVNLVDRLAADLYSIGTGRPGILHAPFAGDTAADVIIKRAIDQAKWSEVLELVSIHGVERSPDEVAFLRGVCWMNLGFPQAALPFFQEVERLRPLTSFEEVWLLMCMTQAGQTSEAAKRARLVSASTNDPLLLLEAAIVLSVRAVEVSVPANRDMLNEAIECGERALKLAVAAKDEPMLAALRRGARLHLAANYEAINRKDLALKRCLEVLQEMPNDLDALTFHGWLKYADYPDAEKPRFRADWHRGLDRGLPVAFSCSSLTLN